MGLQRKKPRRTYIPLEFENGKESNLGFKNKCTEYILWKDASFVQKQRCY